MSIIVVVIIDGLLSCSWVPLVDEVFNLVHVDVISVLCHKSTSFSGAPPFVILDS